MPNVFYIVGSLEIQKGNICKYHIFFPFLTKHTFPKNAIISRDIFEKGREQQREWRV